MTMEASQAVSDEAPAAPAPFAHLLQPISEGAPGGADAEYEPAYQQIEAEIRQAASPTGHPVNWEHIVALGESLLQQTSKDLSIAAYVCRGWASQRGVEGVTDSLRFMSAIVTRFDGALFPKAERRRRARVEWLAQQLGQDLSPITVDEASREPLQAVIGAIADFLEVLDEKFTEKEVAVGPLLAERKRIREKLKLLTPAAPPPAPAAPAPVAGAPAAPVAAAPQLVQPAAPAAVPAAAVAVPSLAAAPSAVGNTAEVERFLSEAGKACAALGAGLSAARASDPLGYRLTHLGLYLGLTEPPMNEGGLTPLPPPPEPVLDNLRALHGDRRWAELVAVAQADMAKNRYCIDVQRYLCLAAGQAGPEYARLHAVALAELRALLARMPALLELRFNDDTPFAAEETRTWIEGELSAGGGGTGGGDGGAAEGAASAAVAEARSLLSKGEGEAAVGLLQDSLAQAPEGRERFLLTAGLAATALSMEKLDLAASLFESLAAEIEARRIDSWEPSLAADCLAGYHACLMKLAQRDEDAGARAREIYRRLCLVDPGRALKTAT